MSKRDYITFGYLIVLSFSSVSVFWTLFSVELFSQQWLLAGMLTRVLALAMNTPFAAAPKGSSMIGIPTRSALFTSIEAITTGLKKTTMPTPYPGALCVLDLLVLVFDSGWPHTNLFTISDQQHRQLCHAALVQALALHNVVSHRQLCQTAWLDSALPLTLRGMPHKRVISAKQECLQFIAVGMRASCNLVVWCLLLPLWTKGSEWRSSSTMQKWVVSTWT